MGPVGLADHTAQSTEAGSEGGCIAGNLGSQCGWSRASQKQRKQRDLVGKGGVNHAGHSKSGRQIRNLAAVSFVF